MSVIVLCEYSQRVTSALISQGINAYSCDLIPTTGASPEKHIIGDAIETLKSKHWSGCIAFPPCTRLARSAWPHIKKHNLFEEVAAACLFFLSIWEHCIKENIPCAIENPIMNGLARQYLPKRTQVIQPWQYGEEFQKSTCLWLYHLPPLLPVNIAREKSKSWLNFPESADRGLKRSLTFQGIADAMALQWKSFLTVKKE